MNKQEAIEKIKNIDTLHINDKIAGQQVDMVIKNQVLDIISQIDEPQKVVVPKFVPDFYEAIKDDFESKVYDLCLQFNRDNGELSSEVWGWFDCGKNEPIQTLVKMHLFGYTVEKEKLYTVEIPNNGGTLVLARVHQSIKLVDGDKRFPGKFTKELIENAGFGWVLKWAKPVEDK